MRVLIDLDDTLVDLVTKWVYYFNKRYGTSLTHQDIEAWELPGEWRDWESILLEPGFFRDLPWVDPFAQEAMLMLSRSRDLDLRIVTSAVSGEAAKGKYLWVHTNLVIPGILDSMDKLIITRDKSIIKGDILFDDKIDNLESFEGVGVAYTREWNREYRGPRIKNWSQAEYAIEHIRHGRESSVQQRWREGQEVSEVRPYPGLTPVASS